MLCQSCGKRPANTHIKTIINGELTEHSLCSEGAQKMGYGNSFFPSNTCDQKFSYGRYTPLSCMWCLFIRYFRYRQSWLCRLLQNIFESVDAFHTKNARQYPPYRKNSNGNCFAGSGTNRRKRTAERKK